MFSNAKLCRVIPIIVLICIYPASSIKCYQCNSYVDPDCASINPNETSPFLQECNPCPDSDTIFCRKTVQTIIDAKVTRIIRSCGWYIYKTNSSNCLVADTDFQLETTCQCFTDACNSGNFRSVLPTLTLFSISTAIIGLSVCALN